MPIDEQGREAMREEELLRPSHDAPAVDDESFFPTPTRQDSGHTIFGEDPGREERMNDLVAEPSRPLTDEEKDAAAEDPGRPERVYAPASARVPKQPAPGDDRLIQRD